MGLSLPTELSDHLDKYNPAADAKITFGAKGQITHVIVTIDIPPVPEPLIPKDGYQLQFWAKLGFSLDARSQFSAA